MKTFLTMLSAMFMTFAVIGCGGGTDDAEPAGGDSEIPDAASLGGDGEEAAAEGGEEAAEGGEEAAEGGEAAAEGGEEAAAEGGEEKPAE